MDGWVGEVYYIAIFLGENSTVKKYSQFSWVWGGLLWGKATLRQQLKSDDK